MSSLSRGKIWIFITVILLFIICTCTAAGQNKIKLEEAINIGIENNNELRETRKNILNMERNLRIQKAGRDWNLELSGGYSYMSDPVYEERSDISLSLSSFREYQGFNINPSLGISGSSTGDLINFEDSIDLSINFSTVLFPRIITESEARVKQLQDNIILQKERYKYQENDKIIEWISDYLSLIRSQKRVEFGQEQLKYAKDHYNTVKRQLEIDEAGERDLINAEIEKKDARINFRQLEENFNQENKSFALSLGLDENEELIITDQAEYLNKKQDLIEKTDIFHDQKRKKELLLENSTALLAFENEKKWATKDLVKLKKETAPEITVGGNFMLPDPEWSADISFSYSVFDGGVSDLEIEKQQDELTHIERNYEEQKQELLSDLENKMNNLYLRKEQKELSELRLQREEMNSQHQKEKLNRGTITELEYKQQLLQEDESHLTLEEAHDLIMISKLEILNITGIF